MKTLNSCPLCNSESIENSFDLKDHFLTKETFSVFQCKDCGFRFTNPRPEAEHLGSYYKSENYIAHSNTRKGIIAGIYQVVRNFTIRRKVQMLAGKQRQGHILDIGCATGEFLNAFSKRGWKVSGIEPDSDAAEYASKNYGIDVYPESEIEKFKDDTFDIVTMWHVLEHVEDFHKRIKEIKRVLRPGGILTIAVPNPESADAVHYGHWWAAWDVPRHLSHFSQKNISQLCESVYGFRHVNTVPMLFDSFYVSMLSEKYKGTSLGFLHGVIEGLRSNIMASSSGEYSSLTYIFEK
ncbi:MAG: methyltransferase [Marinilabiliales bacterium]|nr:MAG: methyltransferase [Marinilabiliales bacterium]